MLHWGAWPIFLLEQEMTARVLMDSVARKRTASGVCWLMIVLGMAWISSSVAAGPYDPPVNYYNSATGTGNTLKNQLHNIIDGHTTRSYSAARTILKDTDADPNNPGRMLLVYDRVSTSTSTSNHSNWNREHTWPRSRGVDTTGAPDGSDLHQLRPSTIQVNSDRGSLNFGGVYGAQSFGVTTDKGSTVFYPGDADAGMIARQQFYMAVRYDGSDSGTTNLELVNGNPSIHGTTMGDLARLIEWHYEAPPEDFELRRNDVIYDSYQGNRNPFIDRPEFVWSVFVDQQNDSQIALGGTTPNGNGGSNLQLDLGRVFAGQPVPADQVVTINKFGGDGTYYSVSTSGLATSTRTDVYNAFRTGGSDSATITAGLDTDTVFPGRRSGAVTIDNLDVTTSGGSGRGANDANDVIDIALDVLDHASPSFASGTELDVLVHDFGTVAVGDPMPEWSFDIFNLESTVGFTAGLELDSIVTTGDTTVLSTDLALFGDDGSLDAGTSFGYSASLDTTAPGDFLATYTLNFSDEDLPGAQDLGQLVIALRGTVEELTVANADFDTNGGVNGLDYLIWQEGLASGTSQSQGDANGDGGVDGVDLEIWREQYAGSAASSAALAVPEPTALGMGLVFISLWPRRTTKGV